jgi:hypothetical protein
VCGAARTKRFLNRWCARAHAPALRDAARQLNAYLRAPRQEDTPAAARGAKRAKDGGGGAGGGGGGGGSAQLKTPAEDLSATLRKTMEAHKKLNYERAAAQVRTGT